MVERKYFKLILISSANLLSRVSEPCVTCWMTLGRHWVKPWVTLGKDHEQGRRREPWKFLWGLQIKGQRSFNSLQRQFKDLPFHSYVALSMSIKVPYQTWFTDFICLKNVWLSIQLMIPARTLPWIVLHPWTSLDSRAFIKNFYLFNLFISKKDSFNCCKRRCKCSANVLSFPTHIDSYSLQCKQNLRPPCIQSLSLWLSYGQGEVKVKFWLGT